MKVKNNPSNSVVLGRAKTRKSYLWHVSMRLGLPLSSYIFKGCMSGFISWSTKL